jgi:hypothetical protein
MITENYIVALAAISTAGIAIVIEPLSELLRAAIRSLINQLKRKVTKP